MVPFRTSRPARRALSYLGAAALACLCVFSVSQKASAQRVYVYAPAPPPPPPPPPPPRYYYYEDAEPPYALALGADLEGVTPLNVPQFSDGNNLQGGGGFKVRVGERVRVGPRLHFTPEVGYAFDHLFATDSFGNVAYDWDMHRAFAGARLSFGRFLMPAIYAHLGYGWRFTGDPTVPQAGGLAFDVGGALDLRLAPRFTIGAHIEYVSIDAQPYVPEWLAFGAHLDLAL